ncbi:MAG: SDR family NAD(P)-dependent oxidoreductase, partial [Candidatus Kryptoniota bacterium]
MDYRLNGLRALVSGSSRGLGFATARLLAQEGAVVTINGRNKERLEQAASEIEQDCGRKPHLVIGDISQQGVPERVVQEAVQKMGGLDLLATNAGGPPSGRFEDFDDEKWHTAFELCFMVHVRLIRSAIPFLCQSRNPSVLTFTSYSAKQPIPNLVLSNSLRAGVLGLTKSLALEFGSQGIRFNSILPA